jgi:hypothetical protein
MHNSCETEAWIPLTIYSFFLLVPPAKRKNVFKWASEAPFYIIFNSSLTSHPIKLNYINHGIKMSLYERNTTKLKK